MVTQINDRLYKLLRPIIQWKYFKPVTGGASLINPVALAPQLWKTITMDDLSSISLIMLVLFGIIQIIFALVGVQTKNLGMTVSMSISFIMSVVMVGEVIFKTWL